MTVLDVRPPSGTHRERRTRAQRLRAWLLLHRIDLLIVLGLLTVAAFVQATNLQGWPQYFEDESTYVSQAWAVQTRGQLSHYTYWYDHPPLGWIQMAAWTWLTGAWERLGSGVQAGREVALVANLVSTTLLFVLARRTGMHRAIAVAVTLLFLLSPLSVYFQRMGLLDNMLLPWALGAFVLAYSPRHRLVASVGAGCCLAIACQMKITSGAYLPILLWILWRRTPKPNRRYTLAMYLGSFAFAGSFWGLMALLKGELFPDTPEWFPGDEHVSLLGTQRWVLFIRGGSGGSIFDPESGGYYLIHQSLLSQDRWLLGAGLGAAVMLLLVRRYRWIGVTFLLLCVSIIRSTTLSWPFFAQFLPWAALAVGAVLDTARRGLTRARVPDWAAATAAVGVVALAATQFAATWVERIQLAHTHRSNDPYDEAADWLAANIDPDDTLLVDNTVWIDLVLQGHDPDNVVWFWKLEHDPEIIEKYGDWRSFDYVVSSSFVRDTTHLGMVPQMEKAIENSMPVAEFVEPGFEREAVVIGRVVSGDVADATAVAEPTADAPVTPLLPSSSLSSSPSPPVTASEGYIPEPSPKNSDDRPPDPDLFLPGQELLIRPLRD